MQLINFPEQDQTFRKSFLTEASNLGLESVTTNLEFEVIQELKKDLTELKGFNNCDKEIPRGTSRSIFDKFFTSKK